MVYQFANYFKLIYFTKIQTKLKIIKSGINTYKKLKLIGFLWSFQVAL